MSDDADELDEVAKLIGLADGLNEKQREILRGVIETLASMKGDADATRWLQRNRQRLLDEIQRAGK